MASGLDPVLLALRASLLPHRRRLWVRRLVRRAWVALAAVVAAELVLWTLARFVPLESAPVLGAAIPVVVLAALLVVGVRARPQVGETALAIDAEARLDDRVSSALELAVGFPASAGPALDGAASLDPSPARDEEDETDRFIRRQRQDALSALRTVPPALFRPRVSRRPAAVGLVAMLFLAPVILVPNPQNAVIAQQRQVREAAARQADRIDRVADELGTKSQDPTDPRTRLAQELRDLARQLREHPNDLDANLARLGAIENDVRAQIDPANEQRASSLTSLNRALSSAATGKPEANRNGDPERARDDLKGLGDRLDQLTPEQQRDLARQLAELEATASQADGAAGTALRDAAQSLAQGDTKGARSALDRLGESLAGAGRRVTATRDLSTAASRLQDARRDLADAGRPSTQGQIGQGQPGQGQQSPRPGQGSPRPGQGQGQGSPGASQGTGQGQGQGTGQGQGQGQGTGQGQGQGTGQGQGAIGGGGSNARSLGSGIGGNGRPAGPTNPNRPSQLGADLSSVFAPFDRVGKPGDPSYVAGTGGDGQTQQGNQTGSGSNNGTLTPYQQVFTDFERYAQTSLDRGYIPLSVKDYVRDYFSSLGPKP